VLVALLLMARVVLPLASALLFAAVLAGALHPWLVWLAGRLGGRRQAAAVILTVCVVVLLVAPVTLLTVSIGAQVVEGGAYVRETLRVLFFTAVTFVVAFIPALGATTVVVALGGLLYLTGHPTAGALLALWGVVVVGFIDNLVKPLLMKGRMEIHGGLIFFALVGGLGAFGPVGLVAGPLALSFFLAVVRLSRRAPSAGPAPLPDEIPA
jgi:predicted PurR-regulated permease PerM